MGLLEQILGGLAGNAPRRAPTAPGAGNMGRVMMALLPVVLGRLANRQRGGRGGAALPGGFGGGGPGGFGGLEGLLEQFSQRGYGSQANSWVSTGPNQPMSPDALYQVFGRQQLAEIAAQTGLSEDETRMGLSELLPEVVDHFTPGGQVPGQNELLASVDEYMSRLPR